MWRAEQWRLPVHWGLGCRAFPSTKVRIFQCQNGCELKAKCSSLQALGHSQRGASGTWPLRAQCVVRAGGQALWAPVLGGCCPSWVRTQHFCFFGKSIFDSLVVLQAHEDSCPHARRATLGLWFCQGQQPPPLNSMPVGGGAPATVSLGSEQAFPFHALLSLKREVRLGLSVGRRPSQYLFTWVFCSTDAWPDFLEARGHLSANSQAFSSLGLGGLEEPSPGQVGAARTCAGAQDQFRLKPFDSMTASRSLSSSFSRSRCSSNKATRESLCSTTSSISFRILFSSDSSSSVFR